MGKLVFMNAEARPHNETVEVARESVAKVMTWYGSHFAGDRYTVAYDGRNVPMDINGEPTQEGFDLGT